MTENNNNNRNLKSNLYWNTLIRIPSQVACMAISILVARILYPKDYGISGITIMTIGYANLVTNFGFNQVIIQRGIVNKEVINSIFTLDLAISSLLAVIFFFGANWISVFFNTPECLYTVRVMSSVFIITTFQGIARSMLRRDMDFKTVATIDVMQAVLISGLTLILAINHFHYWSLVFGQLIPLLLFTSAFCIKAKWIPMLQYRHKAIKEIFDFGVWNFLKTQLGFLIDHFDKVIIGKSLGPVSLGFYDKSMSVAIMPNKSLLMNINAVMYSSFSKDRNSMGDVRERFRKSLIVTSIICLPIYIGLIAIAPYFVHGMLGEKWSPMIFPFQIISAGFIFKSFGGLIASLNVAIGEYRNHTIRLAISAIVFIVSCVILLPFKLSGIALSFLIFSFSMIFLTGSLCISKIGVTWKEFISTVSPVLFGSLIMFGILEAVSHFYLREYSLLNLSLLVFMGAIIYLIYLLLIKNEGIKELRKEVLGDLKKIRTGFKD